jgi:N-ethylmaleimide reductase
MNKPALLQPIKIGAYELKNRVVMAPLTRRRADDNLAPQDMMATHYGQRASAGLIIAEATQISEHAQGYLNTPGIYTDEQIEGWIKVTDAVHEEDGLIFLQLWHVGRLSHSSYHGMEPVAPSPVKMEGQLNTPDGYLNYETPKELNLKEIKEIVYDFKIASMNAMTAGFDGVEIHGANGYLIDQFLQNGTNKRTDEYGGSVENRFRFLKEVTEAVIEVWGSDKVGLRLSPSGTKAGMSDSNPVEIFSYAVEQLNQYNLAYLHVMEPWFDVSDKPNYLTSVAPYFRKIYKGKLMANNGFTFETGNKLIEDGHADLVSFGKLFISNPDLVERFEKGAPLNNWNKDTFYGGDEKGYTDYPFLGE